MEQEQNRALRGKVEMMAKARSEAEMGDLELKSGILYRKILKDGCEKFLFFSRSFVVSQSMRK